MSENYMPLIVVLDTNVFDSANYSYQSGDLYILKQYVDDGVIGELIISDVVVRECKRHLRKSVERLTEDINKFFDSPQWRRVEGAGKLSTVPTMFDQQVMEEDLLKNFEQYLIDVRARILDTEGVTIEDVLTDYFNEIPPFKGKKSKNSKDDHKKHEFPDAIAIKKIKQISNGYNEICVVSDDSDWEAAFFGQDKIKVFHMLKALFKTITASRDAAIHAMKFFKDTQVTFNSNIEKILWDKSVTVEGRTWDRHGICEGEEYDDFEILNMIVYSDIHSIDYLNENELFMSLSVKVKIEVECSFFDEGNSIWDSEEKDYFYRARGSIIENHEVVFFTEVVCAIKNKQIIQKKIEPCLQHQLILDENTLIDRRAKDTSEFGTFYEHLDCECGHHITINLIEHEEDASVVDERGMGTEMTHHIAYEDYCPNCGRKLKISGNIYEYPVGSFNYKDISIEWNEEK